MASKKTQKKRISTIKVNVRRKKKAHDTGVEPAENKPDKTPAEVQPQAAAQKSKTISAYSVLSNAVSLTKKYFLEFTLIMFLPILAQYISEAFQNIKQVEGAKLSVLAITGILLIKVLMMFFEIGALLMIAKREEGDNIRTLGAYFNIFIKDAFDRLFGILYITLMLAGIAFILILPIVFFISIKSIVPGILILFVYGIAGIFVVVRYGQAYNAAILNPKYQNYLQQSANFSDGQFAEILVANAMLLVGMVVILIPSVLLQLLITYTNNSLIAHLFAWLPDVLLLSALYLFNAAFQYSLFTALKNKYYEE